MNASLAFLASCDGRVRYSCTIATTSWLMERLSIVARAEALVQLVIDPLDLQSRHFQTSFHAE